MKLTLGFSPCPNDTFIFEAMVHGRIDTEELEFDYFLADVEDLNKRAFIGKTDITKMSCHAYAFAARDYLILDSGSAIGYKNGPLLIGRRKINYQEIITARIAIPGRYTTANLLFSLAWPEALNKTEYLFSDIADILIRDEADAGLIIHETRFTYHEKGLIMLADMGKFWEELTGSPIPLGLIAINRRIPPATAAKVNRIIKRSIEYALNYPAESYNFIKSNAREIKESVIESHIKLYVNDYSVSLGPEGRRAIEELLVRGRKTGVLPDLPGRIFLTS
ncbi:MAG TPA: 1,4-dihydroxy-6-naphthoate synthase [Bacteroidales bacterium]|nr:1,4-dihydroxy-6-naphthoate synthase [Bacteroidales bacterium]